MFEESMSILSSMNSWFTPAVLFVLLQVMIGTIVVTSVLGTQKQQQTHDYEEKQPQLARSPSFLQRLKSINLYSYRSQEIDPSPSSITTTFEKTPESDTHYDLKQTHEPEQAPEALETETPQTLEILEPENHRTLDEIFSQLHKLHVDRTKADTKPASGEVRKRLPAKIKKSASAKLAFAHFEEEDNDVVESRRPATVREGQAKITKAQHSGDDDGVDAKADDFINKFKQQLKLQRLDSLLHSKEK